MCGDVREGMVFYGEGGVTQLRREFKLRMPAEAARALCARLEAEAGPRAGAPSLEAVPPASLVTSVYFDREDGALATRAQAVPGDCLKVRTKEYFPDVHATPAEGPRVVLEVKRERNGLTHKRRVWVARARLAETLGQTLVEMAGEGALADVVAAGGLEPQLAVTYRRRVYQSSEAWRVTVDDRVGFYRVTSSLALGPRALTPARLGAPVAMERGVVVEVKHVGSSLPAWLAALEAQSARNYSKFAEGCRRLSAEAESAAAAVGRGDVAGRGG
jgi:hypothetical protein